MRLIHLEKLTPEVEKLLSGVGDSDDWQAMKKDLENNRAQLFLAPENTYIVLQIDRTALVILAIIGKNGKEVMQYLIAVAESMRLDFVWWRSTRRGMKRLLKRFNPVQFENGYRINVHAN